MSDYKRTFIRRLAIKRYRSIASVELTDLPALVVLYGRNGAGKSNLLGAAQLLLRAAALPGEIRMGLESAGSLGLREADALLGLRPDDFRSGDLPEIRVEADIELGTRALEVLRPSRTRTVSRLSLGAVFQLADRERSIRFWFESANVDNTLELGSPMDPTKRNNRNSVKSWITTKRQLEVTRTSYEQQLVTSPSNRAGIENALNSTIQQIQAHETNIRGQSELSEEILTIERVQDVLIPSLLQVSPAYRMPQGPTSMEGELYRAILSEDRAERVAAAKLSQRLASAGLFAGPADGVTIVPVDSTVFAEKQVRLRHPKHGDLPLRNLGTGEQQVVLMLGQRVITPFPIAQLEEPEAHLHRTLMDPFARVLRDSVFGNGGTPDVDQLWMATHHHMFAISEVYFDVSLDAEGATTVRLRKREEAASHFYEPGPYLDALRSLISTGMSPDAVVYHDPEGRPFTAADILASVQGDMVLANRFVTAATEAFVASLTAEPRS